MYVIHLLHTSAPKMRKVTTGLHEKILFSWMASFKSKDWFIALLTIKKFHAYTFTSLCQSAVITWLIRSLHCTKMIPVSWYRFGIQFFLYQNGQENQHSVSSEQWNIIKHLSAPFLKLWDLWIASVFWTRIFSLFVYLHGLVLQWFLPFFFFIQAVHHRCCIHVFLLNLKP